jgi:cytochrome c biogenesis protein CcmG/thiol:disulfide interchange protein DsbE
VRIIGLNYKDQRAAAMAWLQRDGNPYEFNIFDEQGRLGQDLGVYGAPETFVVDSAGVIRLKHVGVVNETVWREVILPVWQAIE